MYLKMYYPLSVYIRFQISFVHLGKHCCPIEAYCEPFVLCKYYCVYFGKQACKSKFKIQLVSETQNL